MQPKRTFHSAPLQPTSPSDAGLHHRNYNTMPGRLQPEELPFGLDPHQDNAVAAFNYWSYPNWANLIKSDSSRRDANNALADDRQALLHSGTDSGYSIATDMDEEGTTWKQSCVAIIKCVVGAGSFYLPYGIKQGGLLGGCIGLVVMGVLCWYTNVVLMLCKRYYFPTLPCSYADLAEATFGKSMSIAMYISILVTGIGSCAVYLVFCGSLMESIWADVHQSYFILAMSASEILLACLKSFKYLAFTSVIGDLALLFGMTSVLVYGFTEELHALKSPLDYPQFNWETYPSFFGGAAFLFVIPTLIFPIDNAMEHPKDMFKALKWGFIVVTILNVIFAGLAYMFFGDDTKSIVFNNMGHGGYVLATKLALIFDLLFTYAVVILPSRDILEASFFSGKRKVPYFYRLIVRTALNLVVMGLALAVPNISSLINLVSGISSSFNSFILAPLIYLKYRYDLQKDLEMTRIEEEANVNQEFSKSPQEARREQRARLMTTQVEYAGLQTSSSSTSAWNLFIWSSHIFIALFGVVMAVLTTYQAIKSLV